MAVQRVFDAMAAELDSGTIESGATVYADAQDDVNNFKSRYLTSVQAGQNDEASMSVYQGFVKFDTSGIPDTAAISAAVLELYVLDINVTTTWVLEVFDWPGWGEVDASDFTSRTALGALTRRAFAVMSAGMSEGVYMPLTNEASLLGIINKAGLTPLMLASSRQRTGSDFTGQLEFAMFAVGTSGTPPRLTVTYNTAPDAPVLGARGNFDAAQAAVFPFTHSDPDTAFGDSQTAYQYRIHKVSDGSLAFDSTKVVSASGAPTLTAATLVNGNQYQWQACTWDEDDVAGPWSQLQSFYTSAPPTVAITSPTEAAVIGESTLAVILGYSDPEGEPKSAHRIVVSRTDVPGVLLDTGKVMSAGTTYEITGLLNGGSYTIEAYVWDQRDIVSAVTERNITVAYTPPPQPLVTIDDNDGEYLRVIIANPPPGAGEAITASNDLYRRETGGEWIRIAAGLAVNVIYLDYAIASGQGYEYRVTAVTGAGGSLDSEVTGTYSVTLDRTWFHNPSDPVATSWGFRNRTKKRSATKQLAVAMLEFEGRAQPVAEFGTAVAESVAFDALLISDSADLAAYRALVARKASLCYRDGRGRKVFGVIAAITENDHMIGAEVPITVTATHYSEEV